MDRHTTIDLFQQAQTIRKSALNDHKTREAAQAEAAAHWNQRALAILAKRRELQAAGLWSVSRNDDGLLQPVNNETQVWFVEATADFTDAGLNEHTDFTGWIFPGPTLFKATRFGATPDFTRARFWGATIFDNASFGAAASFVRARFAEPVTFRGVTILGANFERAQFYRTAVFTGSWSDKIRFQRAIFAGHVWFSASFGGTCSFKEARFRKRATFHSVNFVGPAYFAEARFRNVANFQRAIFSQEAWFDRARFQGRARFAEAEFRGLASFERTIFSDATWFRSARFNRRADFGGAEFHSLANFEQAIFGDTADFEVTRFAADAFFDAIRSEATFTLADGRFSRVPSFVQARFGAAPRLDNLRVRWRPPMQGGWLQCPRDYLTWLLTGDRNAAARWRALKRLAIEGHDHDREQEFFANEIRAARLTTDWPLHWRLWQKGVRAGMLRFWVGLGYQLTSSFGRSIARPVLLWAATIAVFATYFLGQTPDISNLRASHERLYGRSRLSAYASAGYVAWRARTLCDSSLPAELAKETSAVAEAWHLAFRNAFIVLDGGADAAFRTYGCLYGVVDYKDRGEPIANMPSNVSWASTIQKAVSAVFLFLLGLGVRNMLKMN